MSDMSTVRLEHNRIMSLDFFRGVTMFLLIAEFTTLFEQLIDPDLRSNIIQTIGLQFHHIEWVGLRFWDLIQPFFTFIVGVAMPISFTRRMEKGDAYGDIVKHTIKRSFLLLFLGWALYCIEPGEITIRFQNVLSQLSVSVLLAFFIMKKSFNFQIIFSLLLIFITDLLYRNFWVTGFTEPFVPDHNFGAWFDLLISGELSSGHWVSFNAIATTAHTIWGVLVGKLLMTEKSNTEKLQILIKAGIILLILGYGFSYLTPIIKRIATSSFVIVSGGWSLLALALCYWIIDLLKFNKGVIVFAVVGMNPLFIYLFAHIGGAELIRDVVSPFTIAIFGFAGQIQTDIITSILVLFFLWYICYFMYKRKVFIKI